jgi:predicted ABC-type ATPase
VISEELSAWLVARREVLDWTDQVALISLAAQAGGDDAFVRAVKASGPTLSKAVAGYDEALFKVGPKGYIHGWIKVGDAADSLDMHTDKASGKLTPQRAALHEKIVKENLAGHVGKDKPVATFLGGGPASGKSTVMKDVGDQLVVDPDGIKAKLPEYKKMVANKDKRAAAFAHEESSHLAKRVMSEAAKKKLDFTLDGTGDSGYDKMSKKVAEARKNGHTIDAKYVTVDTDEAVRRATKRAARTGRMVPETTIRATHAAVSRTFGEAIKKNLFDTAELWDNNGREPKLIGRKLAGGPFQVHDRAAWEKFLAKGQEAT